MGKATDLYDHLATRPLSADELRQRRAVAELAGANVRVTSDGRLVDDRPGGEAPREFVPNVRVTSDGRLVDDRPWGEAPRELMQVPRRTWD
jgi:hypothetical protein